MKQVVFLSRRRSLGLREFAIFFRGRGALLPGGKDKVIEVDPVRGGDGLVRLPNGRDGRQLVLLLMLSVKPSLWAQVR